ncbi:MAG: rubrerythrin family protein, partial [Bacillota bacterium]
LNGQAVEITAAYPVALGDTRANLKAAAGGEHEEWSELYPEFARVAEAEGFPEIAAVFRFIASVEQHHEKRFRKLLENLEQGTAFKKDTPVRWKCNNCGYIHEGPEAPHNCPACAHPQGFFEVFVETY